MVSSVLYSSGQRSSLSLGPHFGCNISNFRHRNNSDEIIHVTLNDFVLLYEFDSASRRLRSGIPQFRARTSPMIILKKRVVDQMNPKIDAQFIDPNFRLRSWHCESVGSLDVQSNFGLSNGSRLWE